LIPIDRLDP